MADDSADLEATDLEPTDLAAEPASAATPAPDASPSLAAAPASVVYTHKADPFGAHVDYTFNLHNARLTHADGSVVDFTTTPADDEPAYLAAVHAAKDAWRAKEAAEEAERAERKAKRKGAK